MKKVFVTTLLCLALASVILAQGPKKKSTASKAKATVSAEIKAAAHSAVTTGCDAELWNHVYHKPRLVVVEKCIAVTGTIHHVKPEKDGDDHIQLTVDPEFEKLLNDRNRTAQAASLVVEPVCQGRDTQLDAEAACRDFHSPVDVPAKGTRVKIVGSFVLDTEPNHGWTEIHPVSSIEVIH